jgi:hypothetical protein
MFIRNWSGGKSSGYQVSFTDTRFGNEPSINLAKRMSPILDRLNDLGSGHFWWKCVDNLETRLRHRF